MDVRCNRCATEYDFDDALISERGTTVKCTNCGYQFKVFPATPQAPDRWVVRSANGGEIIYTSLRELQRGIAERQVGPDDLLSRGRQPPRPLGSIAELEPFFNSAPAPDRTARTLHGVAPARPGLGPTSDAAPAAGSERMPTLPDFTGVTDVPTPALPETEPIASTLPAHQPRVVTPLAARRAAAAAESSALSVPRAAEARAVGSGGFGVGLPTPAPGFVTTARSAGVEPPSTRAPLSARGVQPTGRDDARPPTSAPFNATPTSSSGEYRQPLGSSPFSERNPYAAARRELRSYDELTHEELTEGGRRARSRWIAAVVILGLTTLFAVTVGRRYLAGMTPAAQGNNGSNAKVASLLREGNRLMDEGDLEGAGEPLLRASALADKDRAVLAALARLQTLRADITWLKLRLLDPAASELLQATRAELGRRVGRARKASDDAFAIAPEDLVVLRARVDTLRLSGEADEAREWIRPIASNPGDPQNAYVLAALDLADEKPPWPSVIDRLRVAAGGERNPGRAHIALIYALVRGERVHEAEAELAKLDSSANALLLDELKSFARRAGAHLDGAAAPAAAASDAHKPAKPEPTPSAEPPRSVTPPPADDLRMGSVDFRRALTDAAAAVRRGALSEAEQAYNRVLAVQPGNTEALAGLADIARRRNDNAQAARLYDRVIAQNPSYLPALLARADQQWEAGNRKAALALYHRVLDQAGAGTEYGQRAQQRISQAAAAEKVDAEKVEVEQKQPESDEEPAPPPSPPPASPPPGIDTTDLPELK